ncbi:MAG: asparagine synthase family protein [Candidatus Thorarchaeota archaeon]
MAGIAGLLVTREGHDSDFLLQKMSEAIKHRKLESFHTAKYNDLDCMIVGPRSLQGPDDEVFIIDMNQDLDFSAETEDITSISETSGIATVIVDNNGVSLLRTLDGTRSLYFGSKDDIFAFASERKSLWSIDITSVHAVEPGQGVRFTWNGKLTVESFATLEKPTRSNATKKETLRTLKRELLGSIQRLREGSKCAVLFSGGVDSSLVAVLAARQCEKTLLVTTRAEGTHDDSAATTAAAQLGLPLLTVDMNSQVIWEILPEVIHSIETYRQMDVEIALPFYLASERAAEEGCTTVISGQGPDELFAGYAKHVRTYLEKGAEALATQLWREVSITHDANIERDDRAIAANGVDSFFPYLDQKFVTAALSVPVEWKVNPKGTPQRKIVFRELAQLMGVPQVIAEAPKYATQYSSGSSKAILESIVEHVKGLKEMSKKTASQKVQEILYEIAQESGVPHSE